MAELKDKEAPACKKAEEKSENSDKNVDGVDDEKEKSENAVAVESYLSEAHQQCSSTHQEGRMLIMGRFKFMGHRDTPEHHYEFKDLTADQQLDDTFKEPNSFGYFYIEAGSITHN